MSDRETPPWLQPVPEEEGSEGLFGGKLVFVVAGAASLLVVLFIAAIYVFGTSDQATNGPKIITASADPIKERPQDQGGMNIPHQDKQVFEQGAGNPNNTNAQLGEQPEQPMDELPQSSVEVSGITEGQVTTDAQQALNDVLADVQDTTTKDNPVRAVQSNTTAQSTVTAPEPATPKPTIPKITLPKSVTNEAAVAKAGEFVIQLGAYGTRARAERAWPGLRQKYRPQLGDLSPIYEPVQSGGRTLYRLRAGWVATRADSDKLCLALKAKGQACIVVKP